MEGGLRKKCKIKRVGALRGRWRDCKKKCKIKRVGALRAGGGWIAKKKCKIKRVGALRGRWRVDCCKKSAKLRGLGH